MQGWRWDVFCRVIDNFGDVGVSWRLCSALAARGHAVRLWIDDASALAWMAPAGAPGVTVHAFDAAAAAAEVGDVVVETFGCDPPPAFVAAMAARPVPPVWINLEYLSAEAYVERSHGLRSPQFSGPGAGLDKWFFYPGFTPRTGGLLQYPNAPDGAEARAWAAAQGWAPGLGERGVLLFGYASPALPALLDALAASPALLWVPPGSLHDQLAGLALPAGLRVQPLPWLASTDFDRLLVAADLRLVRGEDSFVRAQRIGDAPLLWQIYPQHDGAHGPKLDAWLDLHLAAAATGLTAAVRHAHFAINGLAPGPFALPDRAAWAAQQRRWQAQLQTQPDLVTQLLDFVKTRNQANSG